MAIVAPSTVSRIRSLARMSGACVPPAAEIVNATGVMKARANAYCRATTTSIANWSIHRCTTEVRGSSQMAADSRDKNKLHRTGWAQSDAERNRTDERGRHDEAEDSRPRVRRG